MQMSFSKCVCESSNMFILFYMTNVLRYVSNNYLIQLVSNTYLSQMIEKGRNFLTLLSTMAGNWHSSPMRIACFISARCIGITDSHSFNCAASSITKAFNGSNDFECNLNELETVQKNSEAFWKQKSTMVPLFVVCGRPSKSKDCWRDFNTTMQSFLVFKSFSCLVNNDPQTYWLDENTLLSSSDATQFWNNKLCKESIKLMRQQPILSKLHFKTLLETWVQKIETQSRSDDEMTLNLVCKNLRNDMSSSSISWNWRTQSSRKSIIDAKQCLQPMKGLKHF